MSTGTAQAPTQDQLEKATLEYYERQIVTRKAVGTADLLTQISLYIRGLTSRIDALEAEVSTLQGQMLAVRDKLIAQQAEIDSKAPKATA